MKRLKNITVRSIAMISICALAGCRVSQSENEIISIQVPHGDSEFTPVTNIYINNRGPFPFAIDTGASHSSISRKLAEELGLKISSQNVRKTLVASGEKINYDHSEIISLQFENTDVERKTRLNIREFTENGATDPVGIIGANLFLNGSVENSSAQNLLILNLPKKGPECNFFDEASYCHKSENFIQTIPLTFGGEAGDLLIDTGYSGDDSIFFFKTPFVSQLWTEELRLIPEQDSYIFPAGTVKKFKTNDFSTNEIKNCATKIIVQNPENSGVVLDQVFGVLGWQVLQDVDFVLNYKGELSSVFPLQFCPSKTDRTLGVSSIIIADDQNSMIIEKVIWGSAAAKAGVVNGDVVRKIILENGLVFEKFNAELLQYNDIHFYGKPGTKVIYFVERETGLKEVSIVTETENLIEIGEP